jgi:cation/acetate symporter
VALLAAMVASLKPSDILPLVSASFSFAAASFVPGLVLGIFWQGTTRAGVVGGMVVGLGVTLYYVLLHSAPLRHVLGIGPAPALWFGILPVAAGVFGVAAGVCTTVLVSLLQRLLRWR